MSKKILYIILFPAIIIIFGYLFMRFALEKRPPAIGKVSAAVPVRDTLASVKTSPVDLRPLFIRRMRELLRSSTNNIYDLSVGDMKVDMLASRVELYNVGVIPNEQQWKTLEKQTAVPGSLVSFSFKSLVIDGINLDDAIHSNSMHYKSIHLSGPVIHIRQLKKTGSEHASLVGHSFSERFLQQMKKLQIDNITLDNGTILVDDVPGKKQTHLKNVQLSMSDVLLDSLTRKDKQRFFFARHARLNIHDFFTQTKDRFYDIRIRDIAVQAPEQQVTVKGLTLSSPFSKEQFETKHKVGVSLYHLQIPELTIHDADWWALLNGKQVKASSVDASGVDFSAYYDRSRPSGPIYGTFPNQLIAKLPLKINVGEVHFKKLSIAYKEYSPKSKDTGTIFFKNGSLDISALSNEKRPGAKQVTVNSSALFLGKVPMKAYFVFNMQHADKGAFSATLHVNGFDGSLVNSFARPLGLTKMDGDLTSLDAHVSGNETKAAGSIKILYHNLRISILERNKNEPGLNKKHITSFLANTFVVNKNNPDEGKAPREETGEFNRPPEGSFFMLIWKTMLVGALKTIGAPASYAH